jgi:peptidoglycan/xylan/chitin deacetylase (PgdA/CDA1 family)
MIENPVPWPNGARCAVAITFDVDTDSFLHLGFGGRVPDMVTTNSWLRYDEIAVPRILALFRRYGLRQTFFYPAWCMEQHPRLVEAILADGHEIGHHGWLHESMNRLPPEEEAGWIRRGIATIERMTGRRPRGFRAPVYDFSRRTAAILAAEGFLYDATLMSDDVPHLVDTEAGSFWELPSHWTLDDWPPYVHNIELGYTMSIRAPDEAMAVFMSDFEAMHELGGLWIAVWHPWVSGRPARCLRIARMIEAMLARGGVWFATMEEIARHVQSVTATGAWRPRRVRLPYWDGPLDPALVPRQQPPG